MATTANISWMPAHGRHRVEVGSSLARALKTRKLNGEAPPPANKRLPDKDFYSFRYNHKPPSVDLKKQGMIEFTKRDAEAPTSVILEQPSVQAGESSMFRGHESGLNKNECVLIYDEDTGTFTLEKLDTCIQLTQDRSLRSIIPAQNTSPTPSGSTPRGSGNGYTGNDAVDQSILELVDDDHRPARTNPKKRKAPAKEEEEEEEEGEEADIPIPRRHVSPPNSVVKKPIAPAPPPPAARPVKPVPKGRAKAAPPAAAPPAQTPVPALRPTFDLPKKPVTASVSSSKTQRQPPSTQPQRPAQTVPAVDATPPARPPPAMKSSIARPGVARPGSKPKQAPAPAPPPPPPPAPAVLALPGSSSAQTTLPSSLPRPAEAINAPPNVAELSDSDEDDWEQVPTTSAGLGGHEINQFAEQMEGMFGAEDAGEDVDVDEFYNQLQDVFEQEEEEEMVEGEEVVEEEEAELEEDEDEDDDMEPAIIPEFSPSAGPMSMNSYATGEEGEEMKLDEISDDEWSSDDTDGDD